MPAETVSRSVRVLAAQDVKIRRWRETTLFNVSAYFQDCISILEDHPEILDSARPGVALRRAVDDAKRAGELRRTLKLVYVLATSGVGPEDDRWGRVVQEAERVLFPDDAPGEGDGDD